MAYEDARPRGVMLFRQRRASLYATKPGVLRCAGVFRSFRLRFDTSTARTRPPRPPEKDPRRRGLSTRRSVARCVRDPHVTKDTSCYGALPQLPSSTRPVCVAIRIPVTSFYDLCAVACFSSSCLLLSSCRSYLPYFTNGLSQALVPSASPVVRQPIELRGRGWRRRGVRYPRLHSPLLRKSRRSQRYQGKSRDSLPH